MQEILLMAEQAARDLKINKFTDYWFDAGEKFHASKADSQWRFKKTLLDAWPPKYSNFRGVIKNDALSCAESIF